MVTCGLQFFGQSGLGSMFGDSMGGFQTSSRRGGGMAGMQGMSGMGGMPGFMAFSGGDDGGDGFAGMGGGSGGPRVTSKALLCTLEELYSGARLPLRLLLALRSPSLDVSVASRCERSAAPAVICNPSANTVH